MSTALDTPGPRAPLNERNTRIVGVAGAVIGLAYLVWRAGWTLNESALWLAIPLLLAEAHGHSTYLLYLFTTWRLDPVKRGNASTSATVDFFIPTYNEPLDVLALTVAGAVAVRGVHETYVLDDGRRDWVRELCEQLGARYLTRADNKGAKAGNINAALRVTNGEFVAIIDADFIPAPNYLEETLGYFADERVAVVQAPQEFYNRDSFQHAGDGSDWHEQTTFYRVIQPGKNHWNSVFWCGSPSIARRSALEEVGGVSTATVTEDLHTSIFLHRAGWRILYHNGTIARGIAPENYHAFIVQRFRWAQGAMQVIRREWWRGGLTFPQRLSYIASTTTYFDSFRKITLLAIIPAIVIFDQRPIDASLVPFLAGWGIYFSATQAANIVLGRGYYRWLNIEMFDIMKSFAFIQASVTLVIERAVHFKVTPKSEGRARYLHPLMFPQLALIGLYIVAGGVGGMRLLGWLPERQQSVTLVAMGWLAVLAVFLGIIAWRTYAHTTVRSSHRQQYTLSGWVQDGPMFFPIRFENLSLSGAAFRMEHPIEVGAEVRVTGTTRTVGAQATVRSVRPDTDGWIVGVEIQDSNAQKVSIAPFLVASIFAGDGHPQMTGPAPAPAQRPKAA